MKTETRPLIPALGILYCFFVAACSSSPPELPYPAYIQVADLPDVFIAGLPGIRAKQLAGNPQTRRSSNQIELPADWQFTTGAAPGLSTEIYVLAGELSLGGLAMGAGGYAYIPPGSMGMQLVTRSGALILYFLDNSNDMAVIKTPLIADAELLEWQPRSERVEDIGISIKELRADPGSGARTWLLKVDPIATQGLRKSTVTNEGFLLSGSYTTSECILGKLVTDTYLPGGYFHRPPEAIHGGSAERATDSTVWFMRVLGKDSVSDVAACAIPLAGDTMPPGG
jgi:hypothetical protein